MVTYTQINLPGHWTPTSSSWPQLELVMPIPLWEQFRRLFSFPVHERESSHIGPLREPNRALEYGTEP